MDAANELIESARGSSWLLKLALVAGATLAAGIVAAVLRRAFVSVYWRRAAARRRRGDRSRQIDSRKREQTIVKVIESSVRYGIFAFWLVAILAIFSQGAASAILGASLLVVVAGFGAQALLADLVAGMFLLFEDRISVGDVVRVPQYKVEGVVIDFGLRATTVRAADGTVSMVLNGSIQALERIRRGAGVWDCEALVADVDAARTAAERTLAQLPGPPAAYIGEPQLAVDRLDGATVTLPGGPDGEGTVDTAVNPGRVRVRLEIAPGFEDVALEAYPAVLVRELGGLAPDGARTWPADDRSLTAIREASGVEPSGEAH